MREVEHVVMQLKNDFSTRILDVRELPLQETVIEVIPPDVREVTAWLLEHSSFYHLSTITGLDNGEKIELYYHFWDRQGLSLHTELPRENPSMNTLTDLIPGASFYEREIFEMLGVEFTNSQTQALLMADDWDGQHFPLRKEEKKLKEKEQK